MSLMTFMLTHPLDDVTEIEPAAHPFPSARAALAHRKLLTRTTNTLLLNGITTPAEAMGSDLAVIRGFGPRSISLVMDAATNPAHPDRAALFPFEHNVQIPPRPTLPSIPGFPTPYVQYGTSSTTDRIEQAITEAREAPDPYQAADALLDRAFDVIDRLLGMIVDLAVQKEAAETAQRAEAAAAAYTPTTAGTC